MKTTGLIALALLLSACTSSDTQQVKQELKTSGEELKKELKSDARELKREAVKAGHEARAEAQKATKELDSKN